MSSGERGPALRQLERLFTAGSVCGMSEGQLLERFVGRRDEAAFEALLARHGPMVLGVCRQWLRDPHEVEDAFQATFLVLVRKAGTLRDRELLGNWLYGVAYRVALRARSVAYRRHARESGAITEPADSRLLGSDELRPWLHEEIHRLPEKYRAPVVFCYLEGLTQEEAAERLHWPIGTVKGRLSRARDLLRSRLTRRGLAPSAAILFAGLTSEASAAVPESLVHSTIKSATLVAAARKASAAGLISTEVATLTEGICHAMFLSNVKTVAVSMGVALLVTASSGVLAQLAPAGAGRSRPAQGPIAAEKTGARTEAAKAKSVAEVTESHDATATERIRRLELAQKAEDVIRARQIGGQSLDPETAYQWSLRLLDAQRRAGDDRASSIAALEAHLHRMQRALEASKSRQGLDGRWGLDSLETEFHYEEALTWLSSAKRGEPAGVPRGDAPSPRIGGVGNPSGPPLANSSPVAASPMSGGAAQFVGFGGGGEIVRERENEMRVELAETLQQHASRDQSPKSQAILKKLDEPISMSFANETPLEDVIKYIKSATAGPGDNGIPIYVDPDGLKEAHITTTAPVILDLDGIPLKTTLRLILKQLKLAYCVEDGLLIISSVPGITQELSEYESGRAAPDDPAGPRR